MNEDIDLNDARAIIGQLRTRIEDAHNALDHLGAPRTEFNGYELTVAGRLDWILENCPDEWQSLGNALDALKAQQPGGGREGKS